MKLKMKALIGVVVCVVAGTGAQTLASGSSKSVRATELDAKVWSDLDQGIIDELLIEFRQGDRLPVTLQAQGDLLESGDLSPSYVVVKRPFWVKVEAGRFLMSLDGSHFKPFNQVVTGSFTVGAAADHSGGGTANAINLLFKAFIK